MKRILVSLLPVVGVILLLLAVIWFGQRGMIYFPDGESPAPAAYGLPGAEPQTFQTEDGLMLAGWFLPARSPASGYTVIVFNGNAGHRGYRGGLAAQFAARGLAVFLFDYRGYGGNPGLPSETGLTRDGRAALAHVRRQPGVDPTRIVFFGESLGAAVAVPLAIEYAPAALILRSPFSSMTAVGSHHYPVLPVRWLLRDRYPSIDRIRQIKSPLLVFAGEADRIVPLFDTQELFDAAPEPKRLIVYPGLDHNDQALCEGPDLIHAVAQFLNLQ